MSQGRHAKRRFRGAIAIGAVVVGVFMLGVGGVSFAAYRYDQATNDRILPGVTIAGVDVGDLTRDQAIAAVQANANERLESPLRLKAAGRTWTVTPSSLGEHALVADAVDRAFSVSDSMGFVSRVWHRFRHRPVPVSIDLAWDTPDGPVGDLVSGIAAQVASAPVDAAVQVQDGKVVFQHAKDGRELGTSAAARAVMSALSEGRSHALLPIKTLQPKITDADLGKTIVVNRETNELYLYRGFKLDYRFPVATAAPGYVTPAGSWEVVNKVENPTWYNPAPDGWGAGEPLVIPPGPGNPLGTRALYLSAPGIRIHGTWDSGSIGTHASHGCIRMYISDSETLYPLVPVGTRVLIF